jgi:ATP-dependent Lon protease
MKTLFNKNLQEHIPEMLPVIPTMDVVVFPHTIVPLLVMDEKIISGINDSLQKTRLVLLIAAKKQIDQQEAIGTGDLYEIGTIASVMRLIKIPEGGVKILAQGVSKVRIKELFAEDNSLYATVEELSYDQDESEEVIRAQVKNIKMLTEKIAISGNTFSPDFHLILSKMQDPDKIADFILSHLSLSVEQAQELLEAKTKQLLLELLYKHLHKEVEVSEIQERIRNNAREAMNKSQKEFYLREQLKAIKKELGEDDLEEIEQMYDQLARLDASEEIKKEISRQLSRLEKTSPDSMEASVIRNYLDCIFALPWGIYTPDNLDINHAQKILDEDHYGLKEIKERILDFISIRTLKQDGYAPILCFVGPPGTGKTSLGKSIARALGKQYIRISLGGVKDEAEIRGHRRTYVGAMPGRFIQGIRKSGSCNPVIVIDELDKIGSDFRGDPSAAMLEVLDPQQNKTFYDNYLGVPFDLSSVMFIATANTISSISEPLKDRMEVIELSGYTLEEKTHIAKNHLITKALLDSGLDVAKTIFNPTLLTDLISSYTKESGVRQLERTIRKLCSKAARAMVQNHHAIAFDSNNIEHYLGPKKYIDEEALVHDLVGITNGLAWTSYGGQMIKIEAILMPGKGKLMLTGQLGSVMKESAQAAMSYARAHAKEFGISYSNFTHHDLHIHVPAGAIPKDGPSAGITMLTSILSAFTKRPISAKYAMTGELNLRGEVMPIGGVKEKILAAKRNNIAHVLLPIKNKNDIMGQEEIIEGIMVTWVSHADEVLKAVLLPMHAKA